MGKELPLVEHLLYVPFPRKRKTFETFVDRFFAIKQGGYDYTDVQSDKGRSRYRRDGEKFFFKWQVRFKNESISLNTGWQNENKFRIYIVGHCDTGSSSLYVGSMSFLKELLPKRALPRGFREKSVCTYQDLCRQLETIGVPKTFPGKIIIYSCSSASSALGMKSFCTKFTREMRSNEFDYCDIYGYTKSVTLGYRFIADERTGKPDWHKAAPNSFRFFRKKEKKFLRAASVRTKFPGQLPAETEQSQEEDGEPASISERDVRIEELPPDDREALNELRSSSIAEHALGDASEAD